MSIEQTNPYAEADYRNIESDIANSAYTATQLLDIRSQLQDLASVYEQSLDPNSDVSNPFQTTPTLPYLQPEATSAYGFYDIDAVNRAIAAISASIDGTSLEPTVPDGLNTPGLNDRTVADVTADNQGLIDSVTNTIDNPTLPTGTEQTYTPITEQPGEQLTTDGKLLSDGTNVTSSTGTATTVQQPTDQTATTYDAATAQAAAPIESAQGTVSDAALVDPTGTMGSLSEGATVQYTQEDLDTRATIQGQMSALFDGYQDGEIPKWAQPAVDLAQAQLSALGLSKSTIARDSLYNAVIGTALNIAQNDANAYKEAWLMNMDTKYKVKMFNAAQVANMDMQNASFAQQAAIQNAQAFLQMDFKNMDNEQRTREINLQMEQQRLLSDQAAQNAALQFNAESTNQMMQFMTQLKASIDLDNAARMDAMTQFNTTNEIDVQKFNEQMLFQRESFNAQMAQLIEQSNVEWRREINTTNTAGINAVNQANATNMFNLSNQALTFAWQAYRDDAYWAWMSSENELERQAKIAMSALTNETMADQNQWDAAVNIGSFIYNILNS